MIDVDVVGDKRLQKDSWLQWVSVRKMSMKMSNWKMDLWTIRPIAQWKMVW